MMGGGQLYIGTGGCTPSSLDDPYFIFIQPLLLAAMVKHIPGQASHTCVNALATSIL